MIYSTEKDFVCRTRQLIETLSTEYEVTLLLNCCLGLLIVPKERFRQGEYRQRLGPVNMIDWGIDTGDSLNYTDSGNTVCPGYSTVDVENIAYHIRNSLSHARFEICSPNTGLNRIERIIFREDPRRSDFMLNISVENFKTFVLKYAQVMESILR